MRFSVTCIIAFHATILVSVMCGKNDSNFELTLRNVSAYKELNYHAPISVKYNHNSSPEKYNDIRSVKMAAYYEAVGELNRRISALIKETESPELADSWYARMEGHSMSYISKVNRMQNLVDDPLISTVCETGFNAGYSALNYLIANPNVSVVSFDIQSNFYTPFAILALESMFPDRSITVIVGDSTLTVPHFTNILRSFHGVVGSCDLIFIDGGHSEEVLRADMRNMRHLANHAEKVHDANKLVETLLQGTVRPSHAQLASIRPHDVLASTPHFDRMNNVEPTTSRQQTNILIVDDLEPRDEQWPLRGVFEEFISAGEVELLQQVWQCIWVVER